MKQKWENFFNKQAGLLVPDYLTEKYGIKKPSGLFISGHILPDASIFSSVQSLAPGEVLVKGPEILAFRAQGDQNFTSLKACEDYAASLTVRREYSGDIRALHRPYDLISINREEIIRDLQALDLAPAPCPPQARCFGDFPLYLEGNQTIYDAVFDLTRGPVFVGEGVTILPGSFIQGPAALMEGSVVKAGTKIYEGTTLGPYTKAGGEIKNVLFQGYANKGHDGFLGDSVVGRWCNFGAGTSGSNLKNNYSRIRMWHIGGNRWEDTGKMFLGMIMGDHSKCAINTSFNTGTTVGVSANIFTRDFPPKFVPSFNWGGDSANRDYRLEKALETARRVYARRNVDFDRTEEKIFRHVWQWSGEVEKTIK